MREPADEIRMIRDSVEAFARRGDLTRIRALRFTMPGFDRTLWADIEAAGWIGARLAEDEGGAGLSMAAYCALAEELGVRLIPEPVIPAVMAAQLGGMSMGIDIRIVLPAWQDDLRSLAFTGDATTLVDGRLSGRKMVVPMAGGADSFLVLSGGGGIIVAADAPGLSVDLSPTQDGGSFGTLIFDKVAGTPLSIGMEEIADAIDETILATSAYLLGLMDEAFRRTLDFLRTRRQFDKPIGAFQALQHRAVDLHIEIALTRASIAAAADAIDEAAPLAFRHAAVSRAKARAAETALHVTREAIQFHGGIGYTDEHDIGLFLRKAMTLANHGGSAKLHRQRYGQFSAAEEDA